MKRTVFAMLVVLSAASARVLYVHPDSALNSIQAALGSCAADDTVLVGPGTYVENIVWPATQGIDLVSEAGPAATVIDGDSAGSVISCSTGVDSATIISGFTIRNGWVYGQFGGGFCLLGSSPKIRGNTITDNAAWSGGGIYSDSAPSVLFVSRNTITANHATAGFGGGLLLSRTAAIIDSNEISWNTAFPLMYSGGPGMYAEACSALVLSGNIVSHNTCYLYGAGLEWFGCFGVAEGNTIRSNKTGIHCWEPGLLIRNNTVEDNTYSGIIIGCDIIGRPGANPLPTANEDSPDPRPSFDAYEPVYIDSCTIRGNGPYGGVHCVQEWDRATIRHCNIEGNVGCGFWSWCDSDSLSDIRENWWGHSTGPYHATLNPGGLGDTVVGNVEIAPWLGYPLGVFERNEQRPTVATATPTIIRGVMVLGAVGSRQNARYRAELLDIGGRKVMELQPGENDVRYLSPGVYFVCMKGQRDQGIEGSSVRKVIVAR